MALPANPSYPTPVECPAYNRKLYRAVIMESQPYSAAGTDGIPNIVLQKTFPLIGDILWAMCLAIDSLSYMPPTLNELFTIVLRKPRRGDYSKTKNLRPIALYRTIKKSFDGVRSKLLNFVTEKHQLLPPKHIGGRPGRTTTDALHLLTSRVKHEWRKGNVVTVIFLDIEGAFTNAVIDVLIHNMRSRRVSTKLIDYFNRDLRAQSTKIKFDDFISEAFPIANGIGQGAKTSGTVYQYYNAPLLDLVTSPDNSDASAFFDDAWLLGAGPSFPDTDAVLYPITEGARAWEISHNSRFEISKFKVMRMTPPRKDKAVYQKIPFRWGQQSIPAVPHCTSLGIIIDDELNFKKQAAAAAKKGMSYLLACKRLTRPTFGLPHHHIRQLYQTVTITKMTYGLEIWYRPVRPRSGSNRRTGNVGFLKSMNKVHRLAGILISGAAPSTAQSVLDVQAGILPLHLRLDSICFKATLQLCTLPAEHPLNHHYHIPHAVRWRYLRSHRAPLHNLFASFPQLNPSTIETIDPLPIPPDFNPGFTFDIAPDRKSAIKQIESCSADLVIFSDGSGYKAGMGAGAIIHGRPESFHRQVYLGPESDHTVFECEITGSTIPLYNAIPCVSNIKSIVMGIDSQANIRALYRPKRQPGQYLLLEFHSQLAALRRRLPDASLHLTWTVTDEYPGR